jgi:hypothetical protein
MRRRVDGTFCIAGRRKALAAIGHHVDREDHEGQQPFRLVLLEVLVM